MLFSRLLSWVRSANSTSSSLKSSSSSTSEIVFSSSSRRCANSVDMPPRIWFSATRCDAAPVEAIRSATASACDKSILPFRKARCVNSPGAAKRAPLAMSFCRICCWMNVEPWQPNSTTSSPVNEWGARKTVITTSSIMPSELPTVPKTAVCDGIAAMSKFFRRAVKMRPATVKASAPLKRTRAMAPLPGAVDMAQIVSEKSISQKFAAKIALKHKKSRKNFQTLPAILNYKS